MKDLKKVAIVTGATYSVGAAIAKRLSADGFIVAINCCCDFSKVQQIVRDIEFGGGHAMAVQGDGKQLADAALLFDTIEAAYGGVDVVVNVAGITKLSKLSDSEEALFDAQNTFDLVEIFSVLHQAKQRLHAGGRIINLATALPGPRLAAYGIYAATKAAIEKITSILASELQDRSISVNAVTPWPPSKEVLLDLKLPGRFARDDRTSLPTYIGLLEDVSSAVAFLAGQSSNRLNGQVLSTKDVRSDQLTRRTLPIDPVHVI